jgi:hypothetical protein
VDRSPNEKKMSRNVTVDTTDSDRGDGTICIRRGGGFQKYRKYAPRLTLFLFYVPFPYSIPYASIQYTNLVIQIQDLGVDVEILEAEEYWFTLKDK